MPRKPRFNLVGVPQHVIQRGNNRQPCFHSKEDYRFYLDQLAQINETIECHIHAYVLMTNHVHLLVTPTIEHGISKMMQALGRRYVYYFNQKYNRTGTLWEGRYKSSLVDSDRYLLTCMRYIEMNPVRANMVEQPGHYQWSSYLANTQGKETALITPHPVYTSLGKLPIVQKTAYCSLFEKHINIDTLHDIRTALNHELVFGGSCFKDKIEGETKRQTRTRRAGRPKVNLVSNVG